MSNLTRLEQAALAHEWEQDSQRLIWWFTEGEEREAARERIRAKREKSKRYWSPMRWFEEIDKEMRKEAQRG